MARKKAPEEHENHERWLVSYADFITLLFAFFVVLYSMSSVNEGKYRVLSNSMTAAFRPSTRSINPIQVGELVRSPPSNIPTISEMPVPINILPVILSRNDPVSNHTANYANNERELALVGASSQIEYIADELVGAFASLIDSKQVTVRKDLLWLEVEINSNILFKSGSADLSIDAEEVLNKLGVLLSKYPNRITVEGFTDNLPIQNPIFPSNWELSSARAATVVRLFEGYGVAPERMSSVGYGEYRPDSDNDSVEGRASNRRVIVVVMANIQRQGQDIDIPFTDLELFRQRVRDSQK